MQKKSLWKSLLCFLFGVPADRATGYPMPENGQAVFDPDELEKEGYLVFGPFPSSDVNRISREVEELGIDYRMAVDSKRYAKEKISRIDNALAFDYLLGHNFRPQFVYFAIREEDVCKLSQSLLNLGFSTPGQVEN